MRGVTLELSVEEASKLDQLLNSIRGGGEEEKRKELSSAHSRLHKLLLEAQKPIEVGYLKGYDEYGVCPILYTGLLEEIQYIEGRIVASLATDPVEYNAIALLRHLTGLGLKEALSVVKWVKSTHFH